MKGLLYKDYILNNGKYFVFFSIVQFIAVLFFRLNFTDNSDMETAAIYIFSTFVCIAIVLVAFYFGTYLLKNDNDKEVDFLISTPVAKKEYVRGKFLYILIAFVIIALIAAVEYIIIKSGLNMDNSTKLLSNICKILPIAVGITMMVTSIELLLFFWLGVDKAKAVITTIYFLLLFGVMAYIFFGDMDAIKEMNFTKLLEKVMGDNKNLIYVQILVPVAGILVFVLSTKISEKAFNRER